MEYEYIFKLKILEINCEEQFKNTIENSIKDFKATLFTNNLIINKIELEIQD